MENMSVPIAIQNVGTIVEKVTEENMIRENYTYIFLI